MVLPTRGWLRGLRAGSLGVVAIVLAFLAHVAAGGAAPGLVVLVLLAGLVGLAAVVLTSVRLSPVRIGVSLAAMQVILHEAFMWLGAPTDCAMAAVSVRGAMQMGHGGLPALTCDAGMTPAGMGQGQVLGASAMVCAHVAAMAVMAALLAYGEKVLWFLAGWVRPTPWLRVRLPQFRAMQAVASVAPPILRMRLTSGGVGRRGPPPQALPAIG
jgi:hypothetical protein